MSDHVEHVVVLMLENRSFDHFLGALPGVDGVDAANPRSNVERPGSSKRLSQKSNALRKLSPDPPHEAANVQRQLNGNDLGHMGGFVYEFALAAPHASRTWEQVMSYFAVGQLPALHQLATSFCVSDAWFSSVPGPTWTNRFFAHSGTSLGWVEMPRPPFHWNLHRYDQTTIYDRLNEKNIPWRIYFGDIPQSLLFYNQRKPPNARNYKFMHSFYEDAASSNPADFPAYAFIEPSYLPFGQNDQHPPHDVLKGDDLIASVYNALRANSKLWSSTLLLILWDEHGGFYDHVYPPPSVPPDHFTQEGCKFDQYGVRVPAILASPWIKSGISPHPVNGILDHTSVLRYLIDKFDLGPLTARVANAASLSELITGDGTTLGPARIGTAVHPLLSEFSAELEPESLNPNQAALVDFTRQLELETSVPPQEAGLLALRAATSLQGEVEVAKERVGRFLQKRAG